MVRDKIFLTMSNMYFFNQSSGIQVNFSDAFYLILVSDFIDMFFTRAATTPHKKYFVEKPDVDI